jgi:glucan phosphorylase
MATTKLNKSQRRAFARICYFAFHTFENVTNGVKTSEWFLEALTEEEKAELEQLRKLTRKLANRWRSFAWKLEGRQ